MSNSGFVVTDVGNSAAAAATTSGPYVHITQFKVGTGVNYTPTRADTDLHGSVLYTGTPTTFSLISTTLLEIVLTMDASVGPFNFGEIGLYLASGQLYALCSFTSLQEKVNTVGAQVGNTWTIRARLTLAQAPYTAQIAITNTMGMLECANWQSLAIPSGQQSGANCAIVHDDTEDLKPVFVVKRDTVRWEPVGYTTALVANTADSGASVSTGGLTHPSLSALQMTWSPGNNLYQRYLVRFSDGEIRKITSKSGTTVNWAVPTTGSAAGVFTIFTADPLINAQSVPQQVGEIAYFMRSSPPTGWLELNGQTLSRTTYAELFANCGSQCGPGDGSTTFTLPDLRGEFLRAWDHGRGVDGSRTLGSWQDWGTGAPKTTSVNRITGDGSIGSLTNGTSNPSHVGFLRASKSGEGITPTGFDGNGSGNEPDVWNVATGDAETRPRNSAWLICVRAFTTYTS